MILRRITQHVREQNWTAIAIDFVIVVVGVFLGIQVSNWNQTRADQAGLVQSLERLQREAAQNMAIADSTLSNIEKGRENRDLVRKAIDACEAPPEDPALIGDVLIRLTGDFHPNFVSVALDQLTAQNRYQDLTSPSFDEALAAYIHKLSEEQEQLASHFDLMWRHHVIQHPAVGGDFPDNFLDWKAPLARPFKEVCGDPTFRNRLLITLGFLSGIGHRIGLLKEEIEIFQVALQTELDAQQ